MRSPKRRRCKSWPRWPCNSPAPLVAIGARWFHYGTSDGYDDHFLTSVYDRVSELPPAARLRVAILAANTVLVHTVLAAHPEIIDLPDETGRTPLHLADEWQQLPVVAVSGGIGGRGDHRKPDAGYTARDLALWDGEVRHAEPARESASRSRRASKHHSAAPETPLQQTTFRRVRVVRSDLRFPHVCQNPFIAVSCVGSYNFFPSLPAERGTDHLH